MTTSKQYDFLNRLTQISSQPGASGLPPVAFNYNYNNANQRTQEKLADGSYWVYNYDSLGQVTGGHKYFYDGTRCPASSLTTALTRLATGRRPKLAATRPAAISVWRIIGSTV